MKLLAVLGIHSWKYNKSEMPRCWSTMQEPSFWSIHFSDKGTYAPFPNSLRQEQNPLVNLPIPLEEVVKADAVIVTHLYLDCPLDEAADTLAKDIPLFTQNEDDAAEIKTRFTQVHVLDSETCF